jgi:hypothetical protein
MPIVSKATIARALLSSAAVIVAAACSPHKIPPMTVADFMEDRVKLDGMILKCNQDPRARNDADCVNARIAVERLASQNEPSRQAKSAEDFERSREQLRLLQDKQRQEQEASKKVDAYHLPLVPVEPSPPPKDTQSPIVGQANQ